MAPKPETVLPAISAHQEAAHIVIEPSVTAPDGSEWVHNAYTKVTDAWAVESHIRPINRTERFGDVASWATYVATYGLDGATLLTWSDKGLKAVLDYHSADGKPNRCQWIAEHPFEHSIQWKAWAALANGHAKTQRDVIEALEDLGADVVEPDAGTLVGILRTLRATVNATADTELRPDGTTSVSYTKNQTVQAGKVELPSEIVIAIPVLKGHPVLYRLRVRLRVSVNDSAHLAFRLSIPGAERALEDVFADRVAAAQALLGDDLTLLRSTATAG